VKNLKRIITSFVLLFTIVILASCSSGGQTKTYFFENEEITSTVKVNYKEDTIKAIDAEVKISYKNLGVENEEQAKAMASMAANFVNSIEGFKYELKYNDTGIVANISIDFTKIDINKFSGLLGMKLSEEEVEQAKEKIKESLSFKEFEKNILKYGFKEK
jgi:hypothetical protein